MEMKMSRSEAGWPGRRGGLTGDGWVNKDAAEEPRTGLCPTAFVDGFLLRLAAWVLEEEAQARSSYHDEMACRRREDRTMDGCEIGGTRCKV